MKFIFPKNYKYNAKLFGFIDYTTAIIDLIIGIILFLIVHAIFTNIGTQVYVFISLFSPIIPFSFLGVNKENILDFSLYIIKFFKN